MVFNKKTKLSSDGFEIETVKTAFKCAAITWRIKYREHEETDIINLSQTSIFAVKSNLIKYRGLKNALKFNMALHAVFEKAVDPAVKTDPPVCLVPEPFEVYADTNVKTCLNADTDNYIDIDERNGSGWVLSRLEALDITIWQLDPLRASSYRRLPTWIVNKHAVTNVRNTDNNCFKWAFLAGMHPTKRHSERLKKYESFQSKYDFSSLAYHVPLKDIATSCRRNNCSINVYGYLWW